MTEKPDGSHCEISPAEEVKAQSLDILGIGKAAEKIAPAALKIAEAFQDVIGIISEPATLYLKARAEGAANRHEVKADAEALTDIEKLLANDPVLSARMKARVLSTEYRRENNISRGQMKAIASRTERSFRGF